MSEPNYLTRRECWWIALGDLLGILIVERSYDYHSVTPRFGVVGEFFMRKAGLRHPVSGAGESS